MKQYNYLLIIKDNVIAKKPGGGGGPSQVCPYMQRKKLKKMGKTSEQIIPFTADFLQSLVLSPCLIKKPFVICTKETIRNH